MKIKKELENNVLVLALEGRLDRNRTRTRTRDKRFERRKRSCDRYEKSRIHIFRGTQSNPESAENHEYTRLYETEKRRRKHNGSFRNYRFFGYTHDRITDK